MESAWNGSVSPLVRVRFDGPCSMAGVKPVQLAIVANVQCDQVSDFDLSIRERVATLLALSHNRFDTGVAICHVVVELVARFAMSCQELAQDDGKRIDHVQVRQRPSRAPAVAETPLEQIAAGVSSETLYPELAL